MRSTKLHDRMREAAKENDVIHLLDLPPYFSVREDEEGRFVSDNMGILKVYIGCDKARFTEDFLEAYNISDGCDNAGIHPENLIKY